MDIFFVVDESGSMMMRREWVLQAYNDFFQEQKEICDTLTTTISVYFFNDFIRTHLHQVPLADVPLLEFHDYQPMNATALYDALLTVFDDVETVAVLRPDGKRLVVVVTDGYNTTGVARAEDLQSRLTAVPVEMVYMGSNQDAILQGSRVGSGPGSSLQYTDDRFLDAMTSMTRAVTRMRSGETQTVEFTLMERGVSSGTEPWSDRESTQSNDVGLLF